MKRSLLTAWVLIAAAAGAAEAPSGPEPPPRAILQQPTAQALRADVSFLASDLLEGRGTPSRGLDLAAEFIAAEFRRAGLDPAGDDGYFQIAPYQPTARPGAADSEAQEPPVPPAMVRNVAGLLRGGDPVLKDTYIIVSAHYDHLGIRGGRIFNGANDNASGTASVIEIAQALAQLPERPKRSILFLAFFGEERGLVGSRYYVSHPLVPLAATVAEINLEQMGRTDSHQGTKLLQFNATGYDYTTISTILAQAAVKNGVRLIRDEANSDPYFLDSDNLPFAEAGIPSTTLSVTYAFPDYHRPGDQWPKLDYYNMASVDRAITAGVRALANAVRPPEWNMSNPKVQRYLSAREASQAARP